MTSLWIAGSHSHASAGLGPTRAKFTGRFHRRSSHPRNCVSSVEPSSAACWPRALRLHPASFSLQLTFYPSSTFRCCLRMEPSQVVHISRGHGLAALSTPAHAPVRPVPGLCQRVRSAPRTHCCQMTGPPLTSQPPVYLVDRSWHYPRAQRALPAHLLATARSRARVALRMAPHSHPDIPRLGLFRIRWSFYSPPVCCPSASHPLAPLHPHPVAPRQPTHSPLST
jgi:hypothetical protein